MTSFDIDAKKCEVEKELSELIYCQSVIEEEQNRLKQEKTKLTLQIQEMDGALIKSRATIAQKRLEISTLKSQYFSEKASGG